MRTEHFWEQVNESRLRQGDYLPNCLVPLPIFDPTTFSEGSDLQSVDVEIREYDLIVLTQSCDLENKKVRFVALSPIYSLEEFEEINPKFAKKGQWENVRRGRVEGLYLLASPTEPDNNRKSLVVDFGEIHSLPYDYIEKYAINLGPRWRLNSPFLEHFSQAFARFFMRVGLPSAIEPFK
ncbi:hypothetical protein Oscil6304_2322 [Oscillatoria acuminata PCC 6304]|uniref:Uncharacterized protein n=1 Tax=Oscillatoria acuminata PCC 6304 TaxID=56110 RepID=K9TIH5_9CYAN|nr:hypothetical protein Oscil6304_2322 [Oscillatoria acuminata PCC 6304]